MIIVTFRSSEWIIQSTFDSDTWEERMTARSREPHYTPAEIAEDWGLSIPTVRKLFAEEEGVLRVESTAARLIRRSEAKPRVSLRISASARDRVYARLAAGFAGKLQTTSRSIK